MLTSERLEFPVAPPLRVDDGGRLLARADLIFPLGERGVRLDGALLLGVQLIVDAPHRILERRHLLGERVQRVEIHHSFGLESLFYQEFMVRSIVYNRNFTNLINNVLKI